MRPAQAVPTDLYSRFEPSSGNPVGGDHLRPVGHRVEESPKGVAELLTALRRFAHPVDGTLPPVAIETSRRLLVWALRTEGVTIYPLNPRSVKAARQRTRPRNQSKSDPADALLIASMIDPMHRAQYHPMPNVSEEAMAITLLSRSRDEAQERMLKHANRLRSTLAEYHPNAVKAFTVKQMTDNLGPYYVLRDALTHDEGARLRVGGIRTRLLGEGARKSSKGVDKAAAAVHEALSRPRLAYPSNFEAAFAETVRTDLEVLRAHVQHFKTLDKRLAEAVHEHTMWKLLSPATGAGPGVIGGLIAEMGDDKQRFKTVSGLHAFAASAPVKDQSGARSNERRRDTKGNRLHDAMWDWARSATLHQPGAGVYYYRLRAAGSGDGHASRKVMNKLLRGVHYCMRTGTVWDDARVWDPSLTEADKVAAKEEWKAKQAKAKAKGKGFWGAAGEPLAPTGT